MKREGEEGMISYIAIAVVSTAAILGTRLMAKIEPYNKVYLLYVIAINFFMIALCALAS